MNTLCPCDEDITTSVTTISSIGLQGPIMRSQAQQLCRQVNSFLCSSANDLENRLLPNDLIVIRNQGVDHGEHAGHQEGAREPRKHAQHGGSPNQFGIQESDFKSNSESRITLPSNWHTVSAYAWKDKEITFPIPSVSRSTKMGVGCNHQNKTDFQDLPGAAPPILGR
jgi:hypothetical protein